ncbi:transposase [Streptomyces vinaceus]
MTSTDALELLIKAPTPQAAAKLTRTQITAVLARHRRHSRPQKSATIQTALREEHLGLPGAVTAAYAAAATAHARLLISLKEQTDQLEGQVKAHFLEHLDAEIYLSMPGIGEITGARVLAEAGDDPTRYASAKARKNYAGTSPVTRASGKSQTVQARHVRNNRLAAALQLQAFSALRGSPGARRYYDKQRAREAGYNPALRQVDNRGRAGRRGRQTAYRRHPCDQCGAGPEPPRAGRGERPRSAHWNPVNSTARTRSSSPSAC